MLKSVGLKAEKFKVHVKLQFKINSKLKIVIILQRNRITLIFLKLFKIIMFLKDVFKLQEAV